MQAFVSESHRSLKTCVVRYLVKLTGLAASVKNKNTFKRRRSRRNICINRGICIYLVELQPDLVVLSHVVHLDSRFPLDSMTRISSLSPF